MSATRQRPSAEAHFARLAKAIQAAHPGVERVTLFGFDCLRWRGKVFAKLDRGAVAVHLSSARVATLVEAGVARPYQRGDGRTFREWALVASGERKTPGLVREALALFERE